MKHKILSITQSILCGSGAVILAGFLFLLGLLNQIWPDINAALPGNFDFILAGIILSVMFLLWMVWILVWSLVWNSPVTGWWNILAGLLVVVIWSGVIQTLLRETASMLPSLYPLHMFYLYIAAFLLVAAGLFVLIYRVKKTIPSLVISGFCVIGILILGVLAFQAFSLERNRWPKPVASDSSGWQAQWIGPKAGLFTGKPGPNSWWMYRKTFTVDHLPETAPARIATDTHYWLWINGQIVIREGGLKHGPNPYDTYYDTIDLAPYLTYGDNSVAVLVWYLGKDGFSHKDSGKTGLLFDLETPELTLLSDASWKSKQHPAYFSTEDPSPNFRLAESNIGYDARLAISGWNTPKFNDESWSVSAVAGNVSTAPWYNLVARPIPFWQDSALLDYDSVETKTDRIGSQTVTAHLPRNMQLLPYLKVKSAKGMIIDIRTDAYQDGGANSVRAEYITRDGEQEFEFPGWMSGETVIYKLPSGVEMLAVGYRSTGYNTQATGALLTDDIFLNQLYEKSLNSLTVNMRDTFSDCPDRERAQWWADAVIELQSAGYALDEDAMLLARKGILELAGWQHADGTLFSPIPAGNWNRELPLQILQAVYGIRQYYALTGDLETIQTVYPAIQRYLALWQTGPDGLVIHRAGGWDWSDWGEKIDQPVLENAWYYLALQSQYDMADALNKAADQEELSKQMETLAVAFRRQYRTADGFRSAEYEGPVDDRAQAMAIVSGLAETQDHDALLLSLQQTTNSSPLMENYAIQGLYMLGEPESALSRLRSRYAEQVASDHTTLWETWTLDGTSTFSHAWGGGALYLLPGYTGGIQPEMAGFKTFIVQPQMGILGRFGSSVSTPYGLIEEHIRLSAGSFEISLVVPKGTSAWIGLPKEYVSDPEQVVIYWNEKISTVSFARQDDTYYYYPAVPGAWQFSVPAP